MIGRLAVRAENASDLATARAVQQGFKLEPLFPKTYKKPFAVAARDLYRQSPLLPLVLKLPPHLLSLAATCASGCGARGVCWDLFFPFWHSWSWRAKTK